MHVNETDRPRRVVSKIEWHAGEVFATVGSIVTNRSDSARGMARLYNRWGKCEQWMKEGDHAVEWMRPSCHELKDNAVRLSLFVLAHSLGSFLRRRALPPDVAWWSPTSLGERLVKIEVRLIRHARRLVIELAEVSITRDLFGQIQSRVERLSPVPP